MSFDCFDYLAQVLSSHSSVLATVIATRGSVPREVGAKMVITADGQTFSTIGGGAGEAKVIERAMQICQTGESQFVLIDLTGSTQTERLTDGVCGGTMQIWLQRWMGEVAINLVQKILHSLQAGRPITLVTPFAAGQFPYLVDSCTSELPGLEPNQVFVEMLQPAPMLLIVGAGHVGIQLATVAHLIGFQVAVQDDRPEWANPHRYPHATHIFTEPIGAAIAQLAQHSQLYVALVTRGYAYDLEALAALLQRERPCAYIGMIGSKRRVQQVLQAIEATGIPREKWQLIYAPIGLDIGALTPEEIAISIGAELILVRRGGTGQPLSALMSAHQESR